MNGKTFPIGVIGSGAWGTALAMVAARAGHEVLLWGRDEAQMQDMALTRQNARYLPDVSLDAGIKIAGALSELSASPLIILALPTQALRGFLHEQQPQFAQGASVVIAAKGIERGTGLFVSDVVRGFCLQQKIAVLSGPSFAADVARGLPTAVTIAADAADVAQMLAHQLASMRFRIYHSDDLRGVEIGGAAKNVLAIAAGISQGLKMGESARAALITRGLVEINRFASHFGAKPETMSGLSGLGDLLLTATSMQSRNYAYGFAYGAGAPPSGKLAEGSFTAEALLQKSQDIGCDMPIVAAVTAVVQGKISASAAMNMLIGRPIRSEI